MDDKLHDWEEMARRGTRGDMVMDILRDWRRERETEPTLRLDLGTASISQTIDRFTSALERAVQHEEAQGTTYDRDEQRHFRALCDMLRLLAGAAADAKL